MGGGAIEVVWVATVMLLAGEVEVILLAGEMEVVLLAGLIEAV